MQAEIGAPCDAATLAVLQLETGKSQRSHELILPRMSVAVLLTVGIASPVLADELVQVAPHRADMFPKSETPPLLGYLARPAGPRLAYMALHYLSGLSFVRGQRIAVMGYSMGAIAVLHAVEAGFAYTGPERFHAAIARPTGA